MANTIKCPACGQADQVEKVSTLYIAGIEKGRSGTKIAPEKAAAYSAQALELASPGLSRRLKPPSSGKELPTRPLNPDMVVIVFSLFIPFFFLGILDTQRFMAIPVLIILALFYGFYLWQRRKLLAKFENQKANRQAKIDRVTNSVERWMKLYYCNRDDGVFHPGRGEIVPADQMDYYLLQK